MSDSTITYLSFIAATTAIAGIGGIVYDLYFRDRFAIKSRLDDEFRSRLRERASKSPLFKDLHLLADETSHAAPSLRVRFQSAVEQSGLPITSETLVGISVAAAALGGAATLIFSRDWFLSAGAALAGLILPTSAVLYKRSQRVHKLRMALPEAFEMMSRAIRAGQTIQGAFQIVARDFEGLLAQEFAYCHEQQNLGLPPEVALRDLAQRTGVAELQMLVVALLVLQQSGGNPVLILENLSAVVRKRIKLAGKVRALTAEGRTQAAVLLMLPPLLLAAVCWLNPAYIQILFERPQVLWCMLASELIGALWIARIVSFDY
ncbi:MAG: type II secretion system F family protein [Planctomycetaceae bacterium]